MKHQRAGRPSTGPILHKRGEGNYVLRGTKNGQDYQVSTGTKVLAEAQAFEDRFKAEKRHLAARGDKLTHAAGYLQWREEIGVKKADALAKIDGAMWRLGIYQPPDEPAALLPKASLGPRLIAEMAHDEEAMDTYWNNLQAEPFTYMRFRKPRKAAAVQSDANILYLQSLVLTYLNFLIRRKRIASDLVPVINCRKASEPREEVYTHDEIDAIVSAAAAMSPRPDLGPPCREHLFVVIAYKTMARSDRILNARWDLVDWDNMSFDFTRVYSPMGRERKQPDRRHLRGIKPAPFAELDEELYDLLRWAWKWKGSDTDYVLGSKASLYKKLQAVLRAAGLVDEEGEVRGSGHTFKHTGLTHLLAGNRRLGIPAVDPQKASDISNTSVPTIQRVYYKVIGGDHAEITRKSLSIGRQRQPDNVASLAAKRSRRS